MHAMRVYFCWLNANYLYKVLWASAQRNNKKTLCRRVSDKANAFCAGSKIARLTWISNSTRRGSKRWKGSVWEQKNTAMCRGGVERRGKRKNRSHLCARTDPPNKVMRADLDCIRAICDLHFVCEGDQNNIVSIGRWQANRVRVENQNCVNIEQQND